jgi:hypothetical protein
MKPWTVPFEQAKCERQSASLSLHPRAVMLWLVVAAALPVVVVGANNTTASNATAHNDLCIHGDDNFIEVMLQNINATAGRGHLCRLTFFSATPHFENDEGRPDDRPDPDSTEGYAYGHDEPETETEFMSMVTGTFAGSGHHGNKGGNRRRRRTMQADADEGDGDDEYTDDAYDGDDDYGDEDWYVPIDCIVAENKEKKVVVGVGPDDQENLPPIEFTVYGPQVDVFLKKWPDRCTTEMSKSTSLSLSLSPARTEEKLVNL